MSNATSAPAPGSEIAAPELGPAERREAFLARLARMSPEERLRAARFAFDRAERAIWAGRYPEEVPTVDGEVEWIARRLADNLVGDD